MQPIKILPNQDQLDFWINNNLNVLFYGKHGVGKTSIILDSFNRKNIKYMTFSAATMDPWVDFIGVPKEVNDDKGSYLDFVRPKSIRDNEIEAIFFDELNRSHKKVRNAVMELIQFKSINGKKFPNLRFIWAAINPSDDSIKYDVEELDSAQADRFHIQLEIPYQPCALYFRQKYGRQVSDAAIDWWHDLSKELQHEVSPRRLEYAIQITQAGGNIAYVLPPQSNVSKLMHALKYGSPLREYQMLLKENNADKMKLWLENENNYVAVIPEIVDHPENCLHLISQEKIVALMSKYKQVYDYVFTNYSPFGSVIRDLAKHSSNSQIRSAAIQCVTINDFDNKIANKEPLFRNATSNKTLLTINASIKNYKFNENCSVKYINKKSDVLNYRNLQECLAYLISSGENTTTRLSILISICILTYHKNDSMTATENSLALQMIENICSRTQLTTLNRCANLHYTAYQLIKNFRRFEKPAEYADFAKQYPNLVLQLYLRRPNLDTNIAAFIAKN